MNKVTQITIIRTFMQIDSTTIIKDSDPLIREKSQDVPLPLSKEDKDLLLELYQYVVDSTDPELAEKNDLKPAVGISAIQVGVKKRLMAVVLKNEEDEIVYQFALADPKVLSESVEMAYLKGGEGCLSVPEDHEGYVYRHRRIKVRAYDLLTDQEIIITAKDYLAIVLQHELDHFKGILYYDRIDKDDPFKEREDAFCIE